MNWLLKLAYQISFGFVEGQLSYDLEKFGVSTITKCLLLSKKEYIINLLPLMHVRRGSEVHFHPLKKSLRGAVWIFNLHTSHEIKRLHYMRTCVTTYGKKNHAKINTQAFGPY